MLRTPDFGPATGTVQVFDAHTGLGVIIADDGHEYPFHCTAIADGTREIEVGKQVTFTMVAGHRGRLEATAVS